METKAYQQCKGANNPVLGRPEVRRAQASCKGVGSHREQREAYGCYHGCRYNGRYYLYPVFCKESKQALNYSAHNHGAHQYSHALAHSYGDGKGEEGETYSHNYRESGAHPPNRVKLDERAYAGNYHCILHKAGGEAALHSHYIGKDYYWCYVGHKHCQNVLQTKRYGFGESYSSLQCVDGAALFHFLYGFLGYVCEFMASCLRISTVLFAHFSSSVCEIEWYVWLHP